MERWLAMHGARRLEVAVRKLGVKTGLGRRLVEEAGHSRRTMREVNLSRLERHTGDNDVVFVPGKVLGGGVITKKLTVGAFSFTSTAYKKITAMGGRALLAEDFLKEFGQRKGVKLVG
ncbi:MAG: 50S ribosomal protein L18e [Candidatus Caldarchaeum sp.]